MRNRRNLVFLALPLVMATLVARGDIYTENYDTPPGDLMERIMLGSPNGVEYDYYEGRGLRRLPPCRVCGSGDEAFYWGNNDILRNTQFIGNRDYCPANQSPGYLLNGYGTGYETGTMIGDFVLGIDFTNVITGEPQPRKVYSVCIGWAPGSNAPTSTVYLEGYRAGAQVNPVRSVAPDKEPPIEAFELNWVEEVDRIVITRKDAWTYKCRLGWYTLDNLVFEGDDDPTDGYIWSATSTGVLCGTAIPVPGALVLGLIGLAVAGRFRRRSIA